MNKCRVRRLKQLFHIIIGYYIFFYIDEGVRAIIICSNYSLLNIKCFKEKSIYISLSGEVVQKL